MTDAIVLRSRSGRVLTPLEHDLVATFEVTRGSFEIPAALLEADDWESELELRRLFARSLPERRDGQTLETTRHVRKDGSALVRWRRIIVHTRRA